MIIVNRYRQGRRQVRKRSIPRIQRDDGPPLFLYFPYCFTVSCIVLPPPLSSFPVAILAFSMATFVLRASDSSSASFVVRSFDGDSAKPRSSVRELLRVTQKLYACVLGIAVAPQLAPFTFGEEAANAGEMATVQCAVIKGDLPLKIVWSLNGRPVDTARVSEDHGYDVSDIVVARSSKRISTLTIDSVAARHAGEYKCTAVNAAGSTSHTSVLSVNGTL